jgi:uncharacterized protein (DUF433 family)
MTKSLRIPSATLKEIEQEFRNRDFSSVANELLLEGVKMRRCPGIVFVDSSGGTRTARIAGTGNDVWLIVASYKRMNGDWNRLKRAYHWLNEEQLRAALNYYECYPGEITGRIRANEAITPEAVYTRYPFTRRVNEVLSRRRSQSNNRRNPPKRRLRRG